MQTLSKILKCDNTSSKNIIRKLEILSQNLIELLEDRSYREILIKVQKNLEIEGGNLSDKELERKITIKVLEDTLAKMSPEEKEKFEKEVLKIAQQEGSNIYKTGAAFAALTAANLSGFGVYLLATTTLSTLSGVIGLTLPFAAYTTLTSAISFLTGPVGWLGAGLFALWKFTDVNYKRLVPAIVYIHWLREKYLEK